MCAVKEVKIIKSDWGIASREGNIVYINKKLEPFDYELYLAILGHELEHTSGYSVKDLLLDLRNKHLEGKKLRFYYFILRNPKSWSEFSPILINKAKLVINPTLLLAYGVLIALIGISLWVLI